jgi:hypothetical protein
MDVARREPRGQQHHRAAFCGIEQEYGRSRGNARIERLRYEAPERN